jgi:putative membrane protein
MLTKPFGAFMAHAIALWIWHVPRFFMAALDNEAVHALQHTSFLITALLFWWAVLQRRSSRMRDGVAVLYLFATMMHTGALGALLTLAPSAWYGIDAAAAASFGLTPLEDQQIGGLIMWIPAGLVYLVAALYVMARWIANPAPMTLHRETIA